VEGKSRPLLILGHCHRGYVETARRTDQRTINNECVWYELSSRLGYLVVPLRTKVPHGHGNDANFLPLPSHISKACFKNIRVEVLPD
jgi:hypothetical protein